MVENALFVYLVQTGTIFVPKLYFKSNQNERYLEQSYEQRQRFKVTDASKYVKHLTNKQHFRPCLSVNII
ncbi:M protein trans-acting positive regulator PRD domain-containing protein [Moorena producens]|uniref:M protein trans-acting positive regulator PRD domain-containing protein n=1 Tax=Moorena producens TaxID=1155739 RepID=UPI00268EC658